MKKIIGFTMALVLLATLCLPASAAEQPEQIEITTRNAAGEVELITVNATGEMEIVRASDPGIAPFWESTSVVTYGLDISSSGKATASVSYRTYSNTDKIYLTVTLQKQGSSSTSYSTVTSWDAYGQGSCPLNQSYYVERGTYRIKVVGNVYTSSGKYVETVTLYSTPKTY